MEVTAEADDGGSSQQRAAPTGSPPHGGTLQPEPPGTAKAGESPGSPPSFGASLDAAIRAVIRDELARLGHLAPEVSRPRVSLGEIVVVLLAAINVGLLLQLFPGLEEQFKPIWTVLISLAGTSLTALYAWLRGTSTRLVRHPATQVSVGLLFVALVVVSFPVVPIAVEPLEAIVLAGERAGEAKLVDNVVWTPEIERGVAYVKLSTRSITIDVPDGWEGAEKREFEISFGEAFAAAVGRQPIAARPLLCRTQIGFDVGKGETDVSLQRCNPANRSGCDPVPFDEEYREMSRDENGRYGFAHTDQHQLREASITFKVPGTHPVSSFLPAGDYLVQIGSGGCTERVQLDAAACEGPNSARKIVDFENKQC